MAAYAGHSGRAFRTSMVYNLLIGADIVASHAVLLAETSWLPLLVIPEGHSTQDDLQMINNLLIGAALSGLTCGIASRRIMAASAGLSDRAVYTDMIYKLLNGAALNSLPMAFETRPAT